MQKKYVIIRTLRMTWTDFYNIYKGYKIPWQTQSYLNHTLKLQNCNQNFCERLLEVETIEYFWHYSNENVLK